MTDTLTLARIQFAANISFHILFPMITIALGWLLLFFKLRYVATRDAGWMEAFRFWVQVFAVSFGIGVVSGVTMSFQFGTNWPGYMNTVGNIAGPLLAYEVLTAFFLEAGFLGIMLFGHGRVSGAVHTFASAMVAVGTTISAFVILVLNSWMQTPAGFEMRDGVAHAADWWAVVFNPSMPYRFVHVALASTLTVAFLVAGVAALRRLWGDRSPGVGKSLRTGICLAAAAIPLQFLAGDQHGLNTLEHQPAKIAAMEANWRTRDHVPLVLFAWPDAEARENRFELAVPDGASLILTHARSGVVPGLDQYVAPDGRVLHPPVRPLFLAFRVMVGVGVLMLVTSWTAAWQLWRRGEPGGWVLRALAAMTFSGWIATLAGWYVTEIGRQPWLVTGVLLTETAVAEHPAPVVGATLALYLAVYAALIVAFMATITYLARKAARLGRTPASPVGRLIETEPGR